MSGFLRLICFLGTLIAFVVVKIVVSPPIEWLNILLLLLSIGGLISGVLNILICGMTATGYRENKIIQIVCLIFTIVSGGLLGTIFTSIAFATKIDDEEIENEHLVKIKGSKRKQK